jgi:hypothetical protein
VAYVELLNTRQEAVLQAKVPLTTGGGVGRLLLPYNLATGSYQLRAYTRWMRNESERLFFHTSLAIYNPMEAAPINEPAAPVAEFLPEGGHLIAGVENRIGFYIPAAPQRLQGSIQNQQREVVTTFSATQEGRGTFLFTPQAEQAYTAVYSVDGKNAIRTPLPKVESQGIQLRVTRSESDLQIHLLGAGNTSGNWYVLLHQTRMQAKQLVVNVQQGRGWVTYPWAALPLGITHVTIFDQQFQPVAERKVFKNPPPVQPITITTPVARYAPRSRVTMSLALPAGVAQGDVAVSVYRLDSLPAPSNTLSSYLWLESELGIELENPNRYIQASDSSQQLADLLMLTTSWSRNSAVNHRPIRFAPEIRGPLAEGLLTDETGRPAAGISLLASARGNAQIYTTLSDRSGKFTFELSDIEGSTTLFLQNWTDPSQLLKGQWLSPFDPRVSFSTGTQAQRVPLVSLQRAFVHQQVEAAFRVNASNPISTTTVSLTPFYGQPNESYRLDDYTRFPTLEEVFREYIKGVWVRKNKNGFYFLQLNRLNQTLMEGSNLLLLNGQPIRDVNRLMEFDPLKVERIDIVDRKFFAGPVSFQGIVNVITVSQDAENSVPDEAALQLPYEGYQPQRVRTERRRYDTEADRSSRAPDFRHLLFWNPSVTLTTTGNSLEFFTSDATGLFLIRVEGYSPQGQSLHGTAVIQGAR